MNGADCCQAIKRDPRLEGTAVVLITSEGKDEDRRRCLQAGCDDFLTKPLDRKLFLEAAHRLLPAIDRREKRIGCRLNVKYRALGVTRSGYVANLSQRGLYMACDFEMKKDAELDLIFALPEPDGSIIQAKGRVAWLNTREMRLQPSLPVGFGVQFVSLPDDVGDNLCRYIDAQPSIT
jgi:DNA-binding response OmpR family regulator